MTTSFDALSDPNFNPQVDNQGRFVLTKHEATVLLEMRERNFIRSMCDSLGCGDIVVLRRSDWELIRFGKYKGKEVTTLELTKP